MKIENMVVGVTYRFAKPFGTLDIKKGERAMVVGKRPPMVQILMEGRAGVCVFDPDFFEPEAMTVLEEELRAKIAQEILSYWPTKQGIAAMVEQGPDVYFKLKGN